jgi:hypothetical protein
MRTSTALALYGLSLDAFVDGLAVEVVPPESLGLTKEQAQREREKIYAQRIRERREKAA